MLSRVGVCLLVLVAIATLQAGAVSAVSAPGRSGSSPATRLPDVVSKTCPPGYVHANLSWGEKCLRVGEFCKIGSSEYHAYGFNCPADGLLVAYPASGAAAGSTSGSTGGTTIALGRTVVLAPRTQTSGCSRGAEPDRRCSPGAYYSNLSKAVICSTSFRTGTIRNVPQAEKFAVEREYQMPAAYYGYSIEIDHIVPLELGGSNAIANLFPEPGSGIANYHLKDRLENRLHDMVCAGAVSLPTAQREIAADWETLYRRIFGGTPGG